jgi:hypothetical protein
MSSTPSLPAPTSYRLSFHKPAASCLFFSHSRPLFSITSRLFSQKQGGGYTLQNRSLESAAYSLFFADLFTNKLRPASTVTSSSAGPPPEHPLAFCNVTSERCISPHRAPRNRSGRSRPAVSAGKATHQIHSSYELASPFNAVFRHSMHGNTIQRKVWSHTANSGKLLFVTEGLRGQSKWGA